MKPVSQRAGPLARPVFVLHWVYDLAGQHSNDAFTGLYHFAASLAAITGPILAGRLIDSTSYRIIWPFCLIFLALDRRWC